MTANDILLHFSSCRMLANEQIADLLICSLDYAEGNEISISDPMVSVAFASIKASLDMERGRKSSVTQARSNAGKASAAARSNKLTNEQNVDLLGKEEIDSSSLSPIPPISSTDKEEEKEKLSKESEKKKPMTLEERKVAFGKSLEPFTGEGDGKFPRDMVLAFYRYWTEAFPGGLKMLWEKQKTFDPKLRLENWQRREQEKQNNQKYGAGYSKTNRTIKDDFSECVYESSIQI